MPHALLALATRAQTPIALLCVLALALDQYLTLGWPEIALAALAALAGALGIQRPTELATKVALAVSEHTRAQGDAP
jgi:hypothetical protein